MTAFTGYLATLLVFTAVDLIWLRYAMRPLFEADVPNLLASAPNKTAAAIFYVAFAAALLHFAVMGAIARGSVSLAARDGALVGLLAYGTYELTNMATLRDWSWRLVAIDVTWGAVLSALAAAAGTGAALAFARA